MKKRLFVIDGHALCYRAYYAFINNPLMNSSGQNTSAIYGFARMLLKLISEQNPDYLIVAFDPPKKTFRFDIYPEYKANRQAMPQDLRPQIDEIKNMINRREPEECIKRYLKEKDVKTLRDNAMIKFIKGWTTLEEVLRVT